MYASRRTLFLKFHQQSIQYNLLQCFQTKKLNFIYRYLFSRAIPLRYRIVNNKAYMAYLQKIKSHAAFHSQTRAIHFRITASAAFVLLLHSNHHWDYMKANIHQALRQTTQKRSIVTHTLKTVHIQCVRTVFGKCGDPRAQTLTPTVNKRFSWVVNSIVLVSNLGYRNKFRKCIYLL